jgi:hypothetical protein
MERTGYTYVMREERGVGEEKWFLGEKYIPLGEDERMQLIRS